MIDLGADYPFAVDIADPNGVPINAVAITLTITHPDGTTETPEVPNPPDVTGQYRLAYLPATPGHYAVRCVTTNPNTAFTDVFSVKEAAPPAILSLAEVKQQLGMNDRAYTQDDDELRSMNAAITSTLEAYKHEVIAQRTITEKLTVSYGARMRLSYIPVISLMSVVSRRTPSQSWDVTAVDVDETTGLVYTWGTPEIAGPVTATYIAGYQIIPYNYIQAAAILVQAMWESRRGPGGVGGAQGPEELTDYRHYTALPRKVMELMGPARPSVM
jgi:hypothetical protein